MKAIIAYGLVITIGMIGLLVVLYLMITGEEATAIHWIISILSMLIMLIGSACLAEERRMR